MSFFKDGVYSATRLAACSSGNNAEDAVDAIRINPVANAAAANVMVVTNAALGQTSTITIPDPGAATAKFVLDAGTNATGTFTAATITTATITTDNVTNLKFGATPVAQVDPASCTIAGVAGAANVCTVTIQLKDGSGTNLARAIPIEVYSSSATDGLTLASAASTGYTVVSGGMKRAASSATITQGIALMTSATGGCVLSLTDTGKQAIYLVLSTATGNKISTVLSSGSYG